LHFCGRCGRKSPLISGARVAALDVKIDNVKQAAFGESVLGRYAAAEVEERLAEIERRLQALETRS
jgi:hypothetical protein